MIAGWLACSLVGGVYGNRELSGTASVEYDNSFVIANLVL